MRRGAAIALGLALLIARPGLANDSDLEDVGDIVAFALPAVAAGIAVLHRDTEGLVSFGKAYAMQGVAAYSLKTLIPVDRPRQGRSDKSFVSGHVASAASAAAFLHRRYGWRYALPAYALTAITAYSRVAVDKHRPREVIGGALIGMAISYAVTVPADQGVFIAPLIGGGAYGAQLTLSW